MTNNYEIYAPNCTYFRPKRTQADYNKILFPYFPSRVQTVLPLGQVSLNAFLEAHQNPKPEILEIFNKIEKASKDGDEKTKSELKQNNLFYFTPSVQLSKRCYEGIQSFTGLMVAEFDKIGEHRAEHLKKAIFDRFRSCICAYLSPSGAGVKFLFLIPVVQSVSEYKEYYYGLAYYLSQIPGFDPSNQSCVLPLFLSKDPNILIRKPEELKQWKTRGKKLNEFPEFSESEIREIENITQEDRELVKRIILKHIRKADEEQVGHLNVRNSALLAGGYIASGYITLEQAQELLTEYIESSDYLSKGTQGYIKTAYEMIDRGKSAPIYLEKHTEQ